ncbi:MAG: hydrogenase maturation protease [Candidatus Lokiarchaeota archaeon]|nr:hydrogenase maturation protease [Candidatus Lokiarchaeota archaeon]
MKTLIIGLGNPIVGDDAIGIKIVEWLQQTNLFSPNVKIQPDVSLSGIGLVELFQSYDQVIIIDSIITEKNRPGTVRVLHPDQFLSAHHVSDFHNMDFFTALEWGYQTFKNIPPKEKITIIGIEIQYVQEFSDTLSPEIRNQLKSIQKTVYNQIRKILNKREVLFNAL